MTRRDIITAIPTSFNDDGSLDLEGSSAIFEHVARSGNEGAFVLGTTGEFVAIEEHEFRALVEEAMRVLAPVMRVIVHVGAPSLSQAVRRVRIAQEYGAHEFAAITPYYMPASDEAMHAFFSSLADAVGEGRLFVYAYPARSGNPVSAPLLARLAEIPQIVGVKASELTLDEIGAYRAAVPAHFIVYTGADRDLVAAGEVGAQGVVSGVSSVLPKPFRALAAAADSGDPAQLARAQAAVDDVVSVIGGDMPRMKAALRMLGVPARGSRMALDEPAATTMPELERVVSEHR